MNSGRFITLFLLLLACPALARGDELSFVPSLAVKEEYNSNVLLVPESDPNNLKKDFITILSPRFEITDRTATLDSKLSLGLDHLQYSSNDELSATDPHYGISVNNAATQRLKVSVKADYQKNSNPSLATGPAFPGPEPGTIIPIPQPQPGPEPQPQPQPEPLPQPQPPSLALGPRPALPLTARPAEHITSGASAGYQLTEKTSITAQYQYSAGSYDEPSYRDTSHDVQAGLATDLGKHFPRVKGRLSAGYSQYLVLDSRTINVKGTIGFSYDVNETWSVLVDIGLRRTKSEFFVNETAPLDSQPTPTAFIVVRQSRENIAWGRVGSLSLNYNGEFIGAGLGYTRDITLASGLQAASEQNSLSLTASYRITHELSASLTTRYSTFRSDPANAALVIRQNHISISPSVRYDLSKNLALDAGYVRTRIDYEALNTKANRDEYFILLSARFPFRSSSQYK